MSMTSKRATEKTKMLLCCEDQSKLHDGLLSDSHELATSAMASRIAPAELRTNKRCPAWVFTSALFTEMCSLNNTVDKPESQAASSRLRLRYLSSANAISR